MFRVWINDPLNVLGGFGFAVLLFVLFLALGYVLEINPPPSKVRECKCLCGLLVRGIG